MTQENNNVYLNLRFYHSFPGTKTYRLKEYLKKKYGSIQYLPEWWKEESLLKNGPYCVRSSSELSLTKSIKLYTKICKEINNIQIKKKEVDPKKNFFDILKLNGEMNMLEKRKDEKLNFIQRYQLEKTIPLQI
ncbi:MAG: hypothetical protein EU550_00640 [Promethearchaeota archaeon]|nr:MAG: hypothetical protein EU550_00640 [Candidatus Lokiarchaeota archaeon]